MSLRNGAGGGVGERTQTQLVEGLGDRGARVRPPYQIRHLTVSMAALLNGFHICSTVRPDSLGDPAGDPRWSLVTRTAVTLFDQLTEPQGAP